MHYSLTAGFQIIVLFTASSFLSHAGLPDGWSLYGTARGDYEYAVDPSASYNGEPTTCLKSKPGASVEGFGGLQPIATLELGPYRGKRVRFSANLRTQDVNGWAGLWMRVDGARDGKNRHSSTLAYDNMQDRPISGTTAWRRYSVVLNVPSGAKGINLGLLLNGTGEVWLNGVKVDVVGKNVPPTGVR